VRLLIVEDEEDLVHALAQGLRQEGYAIDIAFGGQQGWEMADINDYDLLLLDLNLPDIDGMDICRRIRHTHPQLLIIMLTARDTLRQRIEGLDCGADDYLVKPFHFEELVARIRALLRRDMRGRTPVLRYNDIVLDPSAHLAWKGRQPLDLTKKEFGILEYLLRHPREAVTQEALLEHVWDMHSDPFTTTVRTHMASLRRKLGDAAPSIETIVGRGYRLGKPDFSENAL
jgi:DNA-binding response OmpR family regulator